jgi:quinol monooxygenase YgiN
MAHARVIRFQVAPERAAEAADIITGSIMPAAKEQPGLQRVVVMLDRAAGKGVTFSIWESAEALRATEAGSYVQAQTAKLASLLSSPPERDLYEVAVWERPTPPVAYGRTIRGAIDPARYDEFLAFYHDVLRSAKEQPGYKGAVLFVDRAAGNVMSATAWASEADLRASDANLRHHMARIGDLLIGQPVVDTYPVEAMADPSMS